MKNTELTQNEQSVIFAIARNEMNRANYGIPDSAEETATYTWTLSDGVFHLPKGWAIPKGKSLSGTISSLVQKGMVNSDSTGKQIDWLIALTDAGFDFFTQNLSQMEIE